MTARILCGEPAVAEAARLLRGGGLVAFPTETVYGLGADASNSLAVARIFATKGRPSFNPLIVHVGGRDWIDDLAVTDARFALLAAAFWPGPLTMVLTRKPGCPISDLVSAGLPTLAVRWPKHPVAQAILIATERPLAAPSANPSGRLSPTRADHVAEALGTAVDLIVDGGACRVGIESTVVDLSTPTTRILRPGTVTADQVAAVVGPVTPFRPADGGAPISPGQLRSHYAPSLPLRLGATSASPGEALLGFGGIIGDLNLSAAGDLREAAANLFEMLRRLDQPGRYRAIAVAPIPAHGIGAAINDRLQRAAARD